MEGLPKRIEKDVLESYPDFTLKIHQSRHGRFSVAAKVPALLAKFDSVDVRKNVFKAKM